MGTAPLVEIRPGEGGQDAAVFAAELAAAFSAHARHLGWAASIEVGRTTVLRFSDGKKPLHLEPFAGTHRIQRIPRNDRAGRRHTSTATVAVLTLAQASGVTVHDEDVVIDTFRASGPGGQHRNKTDSGVRLRHVPSGLVVTATRSRSQHDNRATATAELQRRLDERQEASLTQAENTVRSQQIADAGRPAKTWTWNDQRREVVDHATGQRYAMDDFLRGRFGRTPRVAN
jgi:peptide chain release factor 1